MARRTPSPHQTCLGTRTAPDPQTPSADTGPTLLQVLQRPNPLITDGWAGTKNTYGNTQLGGDSFDVVVMDEEYPSVQQWQRVGKIVDKASFDGYGMDWTRHIVRAPIRSADRQLRSVVSLNAGIGTTSALRHRCIEWVALNDKKARLKPDWAAVDGDVEVVYQQSHPDDRIPKPFVYAVGDSRSSQKWKSEWLAMRSDAQVQRDPAITITRPLSVAYERLLPLKQLSTYCRYAKTRYSFIFTQRELVALRIRRIPTPAAMSSNKHYAAVEYAPVPLIASTGLTANLAIWALACLGMNDGHRSMEGPGNTPLDSMARLTWWKFKCDGTYGVYENAVSKRQIPESQWQLEYGHFVHLTEKEGRSFTKAFIPTLSITAMEQRFKSTISIAKDAQPLPPLPDKPNPSAATSNPSAATSNPSAATSSPSATPSSPSATPSSPSATPSSPSAALTHTKQVFVDKEPCTATYHKETRKWVAAYQGQLLPIIRSGRKSVILFNDIELEVEDIR